MIKAIKTALFNLFSPHVTQNIPFSPSQIASSYRGAILYDKEKCIYCLQCETVCPPQAIEFVKNDENAEQTYRYDPYLCIYCGECVRACPDKASALSQSEIPSKATNKRLIKIDE